MTFVFKPELLIITVLDIVLLSVASLLCSSTITSLFQTSLRFSSQQFQHYSSSMIIRGIFCRFEVIERQHASLWLLDFLWVPLSAMSHNQLSVGRWGLAVTFMCVELFQTQNTASTLPPSVFNTGHVRVDTNISHPVPQHNLFHARYCFACWMPLQELLCWQVLYAYLHILTQCRLWSTMLQINTNSG